ncbi:phospho-N-acetylmuramoyl-pentapeptide-transferase [Facklamia sp. P12945]|uniref:phospho-N-acetylmuramoyl-pentapeptide- transferase n=1 Tax=Facklamia sp. P12945 TaxID=3421950 RepID=UPI003D17FA6B
MEKMMQLLMAFISSGLLTLALVPLFIRIFLNKKMGQAIRQEGPSWHQVKTGTPTMGGTVFIAVSIMITLMFGWLFNLLDANLLMIVLTWLFFGGIGFADDFISIFTGKNEGLTAKQKFLLQLLFSGIVVLAGYVLGKRFVLPIFSLEINYLIVVIAFAFFWITGFSNAVNLTDGLDGLATGLNIIAYGAYFMLAIRLEQASVAMACLIVTASLLSFLIFNRKPAQIFMGDVGSLALGAGLAIISILLNNPWSLLIIGMVFVIETLSVILQVASFKTRGKRIFKMSPIHHHFEMIGWSEELVVLVFWTVGLLASLLYFIL